MVNNLLNRLNHKDDSIKEGKNMAAQSASGPVPPQPPKRHIRPSAVDEGYSRTAIADGVILDLGEGISLHIPIERRMSLSDFLKVAEKVKALELLSEEAHHHTK